MPDVVLPYTATTGQPFSADGLNQSLYDVPADLPVGTLALVETSNGKISFANLAPGFTVRKFMVRAGETGMGTSTGAVNALDYFQDAWGTSESFEFVCGLSSTFRTAYECTLALFHWQAFASVWRQRRNLGGVFSAAPRIVFKAFINGSAVPATFRRMPETVRYDTVLSFGGYDYSFARESRATRQFNLHHAKVAGGSGAAAPLAAGLHSVGLGVYVAPNTGTEEIDLDGGGLGSLYKRSYQEAQHRVRVYVRHTDVLCLL